jgi:ATP-dependent DNA helicase RecG
MSDSPRGRCYYPLGSREPLSTGGVALAPTSKARFDPSRLNRSVGSLQGVGKTTQDKLKAMGVGSVRELLLHLPFRHEVPSRFAQICDLRTEEEVTLRVQVVSCSVKETSRRRVKVLEALVSDHSGSIIATWYNQAYLEAAFRNRPEVLVRGVMMRKWGGSTFLVKRHEILGERDQSHHILGLVPVYPSTGDLSVRTIRTVLHRAAPELRHMVDPVPASILAKRRYASKSEAVWASHFPNTLQEAEAARGRLAFEELLLLQLAVLRERADQDVSRKARPLSGPGEFSDRFLTALPYSLTAAQARVMAEIESDLVRGAPMRRLLHGDVGSGKTVIATYCLLRAVEQGAQGALMAPTEVLADQHYLGLSEQLSADGVRVGLLKGSQSAAERQAVRAALESGELDVVIGTHALIQEGVRFRDLRVVVVDEQHRFGVRQRDAMLATDDEGYWPHILHMSATPIPRTLSLTLYGDLDISVLDEMPVGRRPVVTKLVFGDSESDMWEFVRRQLSAGFQAYVVCPLIEESESLQAASASQTYAELNSGELSGFELRLLHGQLAPADKAAAMAAYTSGEVQVLVSTSVIEVGVDVAKASVMVIMGARRFGLSQLHQLRGRVGRSGEQSYCFLMAQGEEGDVLERLALFARTSDGFELAEADLRARGEGQLFGDRQSGIGDLEVASLLRDRVLLEEARAEARVLMDDLAAQSEDGRQICALLFQATQARFGSRVGWMDRA